VPLVPPEAHPRALALVLVMELRCAHSEREVTV
jgi:hypothetical protein